MIIHIEYVEPSGDILAPGCRIPVKLIQKLPGLDISGNPLFLECGPRCDFRGAGLMPGVPKNPFEHLAVALSRGELTFHRGGIDSHEPEKSLIHRTGIVILPLESGQCRPALV